MKDYAQIECRQPTGLVMIPMLLQTCCPGSFHRSRLVILEMCIDLDIWYLLHYPLENCGLIEESSYDGKAFNYNVLKCVNGWSKMKKSTFYNVKDVVQGP